METDHLLLFEALWATILIKNVRFGYKICGTQLLQVLLCTYNLMTGVPKVVPLNTTAVAQWYYHCWKHLWDPAFRITFSAAITVIWTCYTSFWKYQSIIESHSWWTTGTFQFNSSFFSAIKSFIKSTHSTRALSWLGNHLLGQSSGLFLHRGLHNIVNNVM